MSYWRRKSFQQNIDDKKATHLLTQVESIRDVPTLSAVLGQVIELLKDPKYSRHELALILRKDQVLSARVLRLVNSGFYRRNTEVTDVSKALQFLGDNTVMALVMGTSVFSELDMRASEWFDVQDFWTHCLSTALASEFLALKTSYKDPAECFTCGLLHDLGKMALFRADPETMKEVVLKATKEGKSFLQAEQELGLPGHNVMGERLAAQWSLPLVVRKTIRFHHRDITQMESIFAEHRAPIMIASLADMMSKRMDLGFSGDFETPQYPQSYLDHLGLSRAVMQELEHILPEETLKAREFLLLKNATRKIAS